MTYCSFLILRFKMGLNHRFWNALKSKESLKPLYEKVYLIFVFLFQILKFHCFQKKWLQLLGNLYIFAIENYICRDILQLSRKDIYGVKAFYNYFYEGISNGTILHGNNAYTSGTILVWKSFDKLLNELWLCGSGIDMKRNLLQEEKVAANITTGTVSVYNLFLKMGFLTLSNSNIIV